MISLLAVDYGHRIKQPKEKKKAWGNKRPLSRPREAKG
jgi:hypothetical protein